MKAGFGVLKDRQASDAKRVGQSGVLLTLLILLHGTMGQSGGLVHTLLRRHGEGGPGTPGASLPNCNLASQ